MARMQELLKNLETVSVQMTVAADCNRFSAEHLKSWSKQITETQQEIAKIIRVATALLTEK